MRRTALIAGVLYLLTFVSIPTLALYRPIRDHADFVLGLGHTSGVMWGAASEVVVALAGVGTAVVLFPVAKRQSETAALGFVTSRVIEAALILVGVISLLSIITLRHDAAGAAAAGSAALVTVNHTLVAVYDGAFLLGQSLMPVFNALCLGSVMYRSRLVPRIIPTVGLIGAPLLFASDIAVFFGVIDRVSSVAALAALPIAVWEFSLGVWLVAKGFRPSPLLAQPEADVHARIPSARAGSEQIEDRGAPVS
jgi:hypothetical protein